MASIPKLAMGGNELEPDDDGTGELNESEIVDDSGF